MSEPSLYLSYACQRSQFPCAIRFLPACMDRITDCSGDCGRCEVGVSPPSFLSPLFYMFNNYNGILCVFGCKIRDLFYCPSLHYGLLKRTFFK